MTKPSIAAIIIGIDNWQKYTLPLVQSIERYEPDCIVTVVDNASEPPYPAEGDDVKCAIARTERLCYSAAINRGAQYMDADWYIVLSNDVLCTAPFAGILAGYPDTDVVGPCLKTELGFDYLEGWCVAVPRRVWDAVGGWDERFLGSDYEDVAFSTRARQHGFWLVEDLPFTHLDQRQRFSIVDDFAGKNAHNRELFLREYAGVTA